MRRLPRPRIGPVLAAAALVISVIAGGCGVLGSPVVVMVDTSLREVASAWAEDFQGQRADNQVRMIIAPVDRLLDQILAGAPGDVVIGPGRLPTDTHYERGLPIGEPVFPGSVQVAIVTPLTDATSRPVRPQDLSGRRVSIVGRPHPLGVLTQELLADASNPSPDHLIVDVISQEPDGPSVVARVLGGGVEAGLALLPDALAANGVRASVPEDPRWVMPLEAVLFSRDAEAFVEYLVTDEAQQILRDAGFDGP